MAFASASRDTLLLSCQVTLVDIISEVMHDLQAHGALMAVSFVVILPISVIIAATWRGAPNSSAWFQAHRTIGVSASTGPYLTSSCSSCPRVALETHRIAFEALLSVGKHEETSRLSFHSI